MKLVTQIEVVIGAGLVVYGYLMGQLLGWW